MMKVNKVSLLKSVLITLLILGVILTLLHFFPSLGHGPLSWKELLSGWYLYIFPTLCSIILFYVLIEDSNEDPDEEN
jgi:drug/metabolite transporter (DMT)-like permease